MSRNKTFWLLTAFLSALLLRAEDWPHLGADGPRSRSNPEILGTPFSLAWSSPLPYGGVSSPSVADGRVVVGTSAGAVRFYSEIDGTLLAQKSTGDAITATPLLAKGRAYVPSTDRKVHVYRLADAEELAPIETGGNEMSSPTTDGATIYMGLGFPNHHAYAFGASNWTASLEQVTYSSPAVSGGHVYLGCDSGRYYSLDAATGSTDWTYSTAGSVVLSSPLVSGNYVYLLPGGETNLLYRVDQDPLAWGANWTYAVTPPGTRPAPPSVPGYILQSVRRAVSSPVRFGSSIAFLMRFDQYYDTDPGGGWQDWITDTVDMTEMLVVVDAAGSLVSSTTLATKTVTSPNDVPQLTLCPTPAVFQGPSGALMAVASSIDANLRIYDAAGVLQTIALDSPTRASPAVANARLYVATGTTLYAFQCGTNTAPDAASGFAPTGDALTYDTTPDVSWSPVADPDGVTYVLRYDVDGEILETYDEIATAATTVTLPAIASGSHVCYAVRTRDSKGAWSTWSALQEFWILDGVAPLPPSALAASAGNGQATLTWTASPSPDVVEYLVAYREGTSPFGPYASLGDVTSTLIAGLNNNSIYTFRLIARDLENLDSAAVEATTSPVSITVNGAAWPTLVDAANAALPGDAIVLGAGTLIVDATVNIKEGVSLTGAGPHLTTISGPGQDFVVKVGTGIGTAVLSNFTVADGLVGVSSGGHKLSARNLVIRNNDSGLTATSGSIVEVVNCTIVHNPVLGLYTIAASFQARNNIVMKNGLGISVAPGAAATLTYNNVIANTTDYDGALPGTGSTSSLIGFVNEAGNDYREPDFSPNVDAGDPSDSFDLEPSPNGGRVNQGAFGETPWAARSHEPDGGGGGGGGGCGAVGLDAILLLFLLRRRR